MHPETKRHISKSSGLLLGLLLLLLITPALANAETTPQTNDLQGLELVSQTEVLRQWESLYQPAELSDLVKDFHFDPPVPGIVSDVPSCWYELAEELIYDGLKRAWVEEVFVRLGNCYTDKPMKTKLTELYRIEYAKRKKAKDEAEEKSVTPKPKYYRNVLTERNTGRAMSFLKEHEHIFKSAEEKYGVPKEIAVSLLLVETDLGSYLGKEKALTNLASMSTSKNSEQFYTHLPTVEGDEEKEAWMKNILDKRSNWAYGELKALLEYAYQNQIDPLELSGSIYGAIGYCQFMPSNIRKFGVDGDNDGVIDLFNPADAIPSLSNYLAKFGWTDILDEDGQRKVLLEYNRSIAYANTIIMMAANLQTKAEEELAAQAAEKTVNSSNSIDDSGA